MIYSFLHLILEYSGGETDCIHMIENERELSLPFLCCMQPKPRDARLMRFCKRGIIYFMIVKPLVTFVDLVSK